MAGKKKMFRKKRTFKRKTYIRKFSKFSKGTPHFRKSTTGG